MSDIRTLCKSGVSRNGDSSGERLSRLTPLLRKTLAIAGFFVAAISISSPAWSHAALTKSIPGKREVLSHSPARIELQFNEKVEAKFSTVSLEAAGGVSLPLDPPALDSENPYQLNVGIPKPLAAGKYSVNYRVLSQDGHVVKNSYSFTVQPPAPAPVEP